MKIKIKDVEFLKCEEYNPYHPKANSYGMRTFWRADYCGQTIVTLCDTKAECILEARAWIRRN